MSLSLLNPYVEYFFDLRHTAFDLSYFVYKIEFNELARLINSGLLVKMPSGLYELSTEAIMYLENHIILY